MLTVGIDEVGRGCWAGPLVACAIVLQKPIAGLKDSKKLSARQREMLAVKIRDNALAIGFGWVKPEAIDISGISHAVKSAMQQALEAITIDYHEVIIDGNINYLSDNKKVRSVIKADDSIPAVSAASIMAKVARDEYMATVAHKQFPAYGFERHVGYGTKFHHEMLRLHGVTPLHRKSYKPIQALL